jgi:hypothetical protein
MCKGSVCKQSTNTPPEVRTWIWRLMALTLMPPIQLDQAFQAIVNNSPNIPGSDLMNYYAVNTFTDPNNGPTEHSMWNGFGTHDRTTNACEGYHCVLNTHIHGRNPDSYAFIKLLQQHDAEFERRIRQLETGAPARKRKATYAAVDLAVDRLREIYFTGRIPNVG